MNIPVHELVESPVSGLYVRRGISRFQGGTSAVISEVVEAVRLDVDGSFPQMIASGWFISDRIVNPGWVHWFAKRLTEVGSGVWEGDLVERRGNQDAGPAPESAYSGSARPAPAPPGLVYPNLVYPKLTITFIDGAPDMTRVLTYESPYRYRRSPSSKTPERASFPSATPPNDLGSV